MFRRSIKEEFLSELERWINEVVEQKANDRNKEIPIMIRTGFLNSMKANADFHHAVANILDKKDDTALVKYHLLMWHIYKKIAQ